MVDVAFFAAGGECITAAARAGVVAGCAAVGYPIVCIFFGFAVFTFGFIFGFAIGCGLPLHVFWGVGSSAGQCDNVIDYVARTGAMVVAVGWAWMFEFKGVFGGLAADSGFSACG